MTAIDPDDHTVDELTAELDTVDDEDELQAILEAERAGQDRATAREAVHQRLAEIGADGDESDGVEEGTETEGEYEETKEDVGEEAQDDAAEAADDEPAEAEAADDEPAEDDGLSHPTRDKKHVRALADGDYADLWVFCETQGGELLEVSKEMLGKGRELMDQFADDYGDEERVVAFLMGDDCESLAEECIAYGADVAVYHEDERLERFLHKPYTEISAHMARGEGPSRAPTGATTTSRATSCSRRRTTGGTSRRRSRPNSTPDSLRTVRTCSSKRTRSRTRSKPANPGSRRPSKRSCT